jgi:D-alanine--poly(phosphoribitol) ligase subunit 2
MEEKVLEILEELCGTDEVRENRDINLFEAGLLNSLGVIELLLQIKDKMGIIIQPTEIEREDIETPNKIIDYLAKKA